MITYQDLLKVSDNERDRAEFVRKVIRDHKASDLYQIAESANEYDKGQNTTISNYQKTITLVTGQVVPDVFAPTHRMCSNFFSIFTTQLNQYELGNGVQWDDKDAAEKVVGKDFDNKLQKLGKYALCGGVAFGFFNADHLVAFSVREFAPLKDEETGKLSAGVRFWQLADNKPMRAVLYEPDGFTPFLWSKKEIDDDSWIPLGDGAYCKPKQAYSWISIGDRKDREDGTEEIIPDESIKGFPIIPLYANPHEQSELVNMRQKIDAYDFILNGFEDDLDNAQLYWIIKGAGGMEDVDLQQFIERLKTIKAAAPADGQDVQAVPVEIPYAARETLLARLERQLYRDAMIMNPEDIQGGAVTATQINAAYERQNVKADQYEYCLLDFMNQLMELVGLDENPTFHRSKLINEGEELAKVIQAAQFLEEDYVVRKILAILGDGDKADEIIEKRAANELEQIKMSDDDEGDVQINE